MISSCYVYLVLYQFFCIDYKKAKFRLMLQLSHQLGFFLIMMKLPNESEDKI